MSMIIVAEDRFFLEDQRGPRIGYMGSVDRTFARTEERKVKSDWKNTEIWKANGRCMEDI